MRIRAVVDSLDEVDEKYHDLYTEKDGKWELTGVIGMKTEADIARLQTSLQKERNDHKETKRKFQSLGDMNPEEILEKLDRISELEEAAKGKLDDKKIDELVETRIRSRLAPLERTKRELENQNKELADKVGTFETKERRRTIADKVREAGKKLKVLDTAIEDAILLAEREFEVTDDNNVLTKDGMSPESWFTDLQPKRPHWWGGSGGLGARGNQGGGPAANPWTNENWNLTEQGKIYRQNPERAAQLAKAAGTKVGGSRPKSK